MWRWMQVLRSAYPALRARPRGGFTESPGQPVGHQFRPERTPALSRSLFGLGDLIGYEIDESTGRREPFFISSPPDLAEAVVYAKAAAAQGDSQ